MFRTETSLLEPDPRNDDLVIVDGATGVTRAATIKDFYHRVEALNLNSDFPADVVDQFNLARNAFVYSWFCLEFNTLAELQALATVELALKSRFFVDGESEPTGRGLDQLFEQAFKRGWLKREDFLMPGTSLTIVQFMRMQRNELMHGTKRLLPDGSLTMLRCCHEMINALYAQK